MRLLITLAALFLGYFAWQRICAEIYGSAEIDYRGGKIKLTRKYADYDVYKNSGDNILASELPRIEKITTDTPIAKEFQNWAAFADEAFALKVPGYGAGTGQSVAGAGRKFLVALVEIPTRPNENRSRYFVVEQMPDQSCRVVDDFVSKGYPYFHQVQLKEGRLIYTSKDGTITRESPELGNWSKKE